MDEAIQKFKIILLSLSARHFKTQNGVTPRFWLLLGPDTWVRYYFTKGVSLESTSDNSGGSPARQVFSSAFQFATVFSS